MKGIADWEVAMVEAWDVAAAGRLAAVPTVSANAAAAAVTAIARRRRGWLWPVCPDLVRLFSFMVCAFLC
ncbi:hypothetical protein GCM10009690_21480 [Brevibacterium permense]|uniref:Uncharacterized protein n=1 Tax=Brevibacterium permense TaxID=234834 RepID=A0ABN2AGN8_9MICO